MKISVFGTGYVGLVTGVCFAEMGNDVVCVDVDEQKIANLKRAVSPIHEPGLDELIVSNLKARRIDFTCDVAHAVAHAEILFIAVGTPSDEDGSADLHYVRNVAESIAQHMDGYKVVINKSTVPVGTQKLVTKTIQTVLRGRGVSHDFDVVSNPEFLREGQAIEDCLKPNRVVVGVQSTKAENLLRKLYDPFLKSGNPLLVMNPESSEMTKYAANGLLATKISFMNEMSVICEKVGADIEQVRKGVGSDFRIGPHFLFAGVGYGGSCFPKDVKALIHIGKSVDARMSLLSAVEEVNREQRSRFVARVHDLLGNHLEGRRVGVWGVAFKPGTDDIREAPALDLIRSLIDSGVRVQAYDPVAAENAKRYFGNHEALRFYEDQYDAVDGVDALCVVTEWKSFREPDFERIKKLMKVPVVVDGRNIYRVDDMRELGFAYYSVGREEVRR